LYNPEQYDTTTSPYTLSNISPPENIEDRNDEKCDAMQQLKQPGASIGNTSAPHHNSIIYLSTIMPSQVPPQLPLQPPPFTNKNSTCSNTEHKVGKKIEQFILLLEHRIDKRRIKTKSLLPPPRKQPMHITTPRMIYTIGLSKHTLSSSLFSTDIVYPPPSLHGYIAPHLTSEKYSSKSYSNDITIPTTIASTMEESDASILRSSNPTSTMDKCDNGHIPFISPTPEVVGITLPPSDEKESSWKHWNDITNDANFGFGITSSVQSPNDNDTKPPLFIPSSVGHGVETIRFQVRQHEERVQASLILLENESDTTTHAVAHATNESINLFTNFAFNPGNDVKPLEVTVCNLTTSSTYSTKDLCSLVNSDKDRNDTNMDIIENDTAIICHTSKAGNGTDKGIQKIEYTPSGKIHILDDDTSTIRPTSTTGNNTEYS